jgi:hypothetical protein
MRWIGWRLCVLSLFRHWYGVNSVFFLRLMRCIQVHADACDDGS